MSGGRYEPDFTDEVTHLVAFKVGTEKYHTALAKNIPVLMPSFIDEYHSTASKLDLHKLAKNIPPFYGLHFSVTGVPLDDRAELAAMITKNGGVFSLDFDRTCSHLIVGTELSASSKRSLAEKLSIPLVTVDWVRECIARNRCLQEHEANGLLPLTQSFLYDRITLEDIKNASPWPPYFKRLFFYVDEEKLERKKFDILKKLILYPQGNRFSDFCSHKKLFTHYILHNVSLSSSDMENLAQYSESESMPLIVHEQWIFECFYAKSIVPVDGFVESEQRIRQIVEESQVSTDSSASYNSQPNPKKVKLLRVGQENSTTSTSKTPLFSGLAFKLAHFDSSDCRMAELIDLIEENGGSIIESVNEKADYCIAPLILKEEKHDEDYLNEIWLLHSIKERKLAVTSKKGYQTIFSPHFNASAFSEVLISLGALSGEYRDYFGKLAKAVGISCSEDLSSQNTHLLIDSPKGLKYDFAEKEGIPCVRSAWLRDSIVNGSPLALKDYTVKSMSAEKENIPPVDISGSENRLYSSSVAGPNEKMENLPTPSLSLSHNVAEEQNSQVFNVQEDPFNVKSEGNTDQIKDLFKGLTFTCSARFLMDEVQEMERLIEEMGGSFVWSVSRDITHYIHKGLYAEENFLNFKKVRKLNKIIVSPWWLRECRKQGVLLNEVDYPHTFKMATGSQGHQKDEKIAPSNESSLPVQENIDYESIIEAAKRKESAKHTKIVRDPTSESALVLRKKEEEVQTVKTFLLMGLTTDKKASLAKIIKDLGGVVLTTNWSDAVTHVVAGSIQTSEKFLAACASGIWILTPDYVSFAEKRKSLDCEVEFEVTSLNAVPCTEPGLLLLPRYWRQERMRGRRPFDDWKCLLAADVTKLSGLKNVLKAGGAQVWTHSDDLSDVCPEEITHLLVSSNKTLQRFPEHFIKGCALAMKKLDFIAEHLCNV